MMNSYLVFLICFVFAIFLSIILFVIKIVEWKKIKPNARTRICFDCDFHYNSRKGEREFLYCPYCGKKTYGFDDESFERFDKEHFVNKC